MRIIHGGKGDDTPLVAKLRALTAQAERGEFVEFVFIGLNPAEPGKLQEAQLDWFSHHSEQVSLPLSGAVSRAAHLLLHVQPGTRFR